MLVLEHCILKVEKEPSKDAHSYASLLADLFKKPDLEFGSFPVIFSGKHSDLKSTAIFRVTFNESQKTSHYAGDDMRLYFLSEKLGEKLVGRKGLGSSADSIIASIMAERGKLKPESSSLTLKSGTEGK